MDDVGVRAEPYVIENGGGDSGSVRERDDCQIATPIMDSVAKVAVQTRGLTMMPMAWKTSREALLVPPEEVAAALVIAQAALYSSDKLVVSLDEIAAELVVGSGREGVYPSEKRRVSLKGDAVELVTAPTAR
ncbi:hypothetical protein PI124_g17044 [Phytophthora idaei]|nr:hypothetical protein PI124_g17044 [Phytophthora idaei]